jgi:hypothetical protein
MNDLWAMHLMGPDDIYAAPSKAEALEVANRINYEFRDREIKPHAVVVPWDGSDESHKAQAEFWKDEWGSVVEEWA